MTFCHTFRAGHAFSCFGFDPETPAEDYEIHFVRTQDPGYIPPDAEAWPLYYRAAVQTLAAFPEALNAVRQAVQSTIDDIRGLRALPPDRRNLYPDPPYPT